MKEESLNWDLKYVVSRQLGDFAWVCGELITELDHELTSCPTSGLSLPTLSALPPPHSQQCYLEQRLQEQAGGQEPFVHPLSVFTSSWGPKGGMGGSGNVSPGHRDSVVPGSHCLPSVGPGQVCLQNVQTQMDGCLSRDTFLISSWKYLAPEMLLGTSWRLSIIDSQLPALRMYIWPNLGQS